MASSTTPAPGQAPSLTCWQRFVNCLIAIFCCWCVKPYRPRQQYAQNLQPGALPTGVKMTPRTTTITRPTTTVTSRRRATSIPPVASGSTTATPSSQRTSQAAGTSQQASGTGSTASGGIPAPAVRTVSTPANIDGCKQALTNLIQQHADEIPSMPIVKWSQGGGEYYRQAVTDNDITDMKEMFIEDIQICHEWCMLEMESCQPNQFVKKNQELREYLMTLRNTRYQLARLTPPGEIKPFFPGRTGFINHDYQQCGYISATLAALHEGIADYFILRPLKHPGNLITETVDIQGLENALRDANNQIRQEHTILAALKRNYESGLYDAAPDPQAYYNDCARTHNEVITRLQARITELTNQLDAARERKVEIERNNRKFDELTRLSKLQQTWRNLRPILLFGDNRGQPFPGSVNDLIPDRYQLVRKAFPNPAVNKQQMKDFLDGDWRALAAGGGLHWWSYIKNNDGTIDCINDSTVTYNCFRNSTALYNHFTTKDWTRQQLNYYE